MPPQILTIKVGEQQIMCITERSCSSTDLRDDSAIPTKEKQQKEVQALK